MQSVSLEQSSRKTVIFQEQIISITNIYIYFLHQIGAIVYINALLCKYFATCMKKKKIMNSLLYAVWDIFF